MDGLNADLMNLTAGRELDHVIAERVMGLGSTAEPAHYSTDENEARAVAAHLESQNFNVMTRLTEADAYQCQVFGHGGRYETEVGAEGKSIAEAICLAALEAVTMAEMPIQDADWTDKTEEPPPLSL